MAKKKLNFWYIICLVAFVLYIFIAARPIPRETVVTPRWIVSLESDPAVIERFDILSVDRPLPFRLGGRFGYVWDDGRFAINQNTNAYLSLSENHWAEYEAIPPYIRVMNPLNEMVMMIEDPHGYPLFLDNRIFIVGSEQQSLTALGSDGRQLWTHDFSATLTVIDASNGYVLAGTVDGNLELLNPQGRLVFPPFAPGGSRLSVIVGCAISSDASMLAVISGIDNQRFLLLERADDNFRVIFHEFLGEGFRRPVRINFINNDTMVVFERENGVGIFSVGSRSSRNIDLEGEIVAIDSYGGGRFIFLVTSQAPGEKRLVTIRYPGCIVSEARFKSENVFFARRGETLFLAGDSAMASFALEKR